MKAAKIIAKILVAMAAVAGVVYVVATYGNQIVAWCKKVLASLPCPNCKVEVTCEVDAQAEEAAVEEAAEEVTAEEPAAEEAVVAEPAAEESVVAEDADFEA